MDVKPARKKSVASLLKIVVATIVALAVVVMGPGLLKLESSQALAGVCTKTAYRAFWACIHEALDDYNIARGNCANLSDPADRGDCFDSAVADRAEALQELCPAQREARLEVCEDLGEGPYDPQLDSENFVDPEEIGDGVNPNAYFPLVPGAWWNYETRDGDGKLIERIRVEVTRETKEIEYPAESGNIFECVVVSDRVFEVDGDEKMGVDEDEDEGTLVEDTKDWYAQDKDGNVWYMGEIAQNFEDGDLVDIEGSWTAGRDLSKPGILMEADPQVGDVYRQEFALGDAEDLAEVISRGGAVPTAAKKKSEAEDDDVLQTKDFSPIEPDVFEFKYYVPGVGCVREENPNTGEVVELVDHGILPAL